MTAVAKVELFLDPGCPWTWRAAGWLRAAVPAHTVQWRPFPLALLHPGPPPPAWRAQSELSWRALRVIAWLDRNGQPDTAGDFYQQLGRRLHDDGRHPAPELLAEAVAASGLAEEASVAAAAEDQTLDADLAAAFNEASQLVGPELGSPVLALTDPNGRRRGLFGPVLTTTPGANDVAALWSAAVTLAFTESFSELKRGRDNGRLDPALRQHLNPDTTS